VLIGLAACLALLGAAAFPLYWMLVTSLTPSSGLFASDARLLPKWSEIGVYRDAFHGTSVTTWVRNSAIVAVTITFGQLLTSSMAAYAFARLRFRGRSSLFALYLATLIIPSQVTLIPNYLIVRDLHWHNTYVGLIAPFVVSVFSTFLLRQFFLTIPADLEDAARIDGAGPLAMFRYVLFPYIRPTLVVAGLFRLIDSIKAFPLIYVLTDGGPGGATEVTNYYAFVQTFNFSYWGYGSAIATLMIAGVFLLSWAISVAVFKLRRIDRLDDALQRIPASTVAGGSD